ncbi:type VI secretion system baseplate subunit TssF [Nitrospirales bacterium NOB]|nr:type VI secretion system baseplate subunit TssF [Nitrospirales bacterium NOB]
MPEVRVVTFNRYYKDELEFLRQMGREFAEAHPKEAHLLADVGSDPDVERLLEGVAFLTGRIRQKLDDEFPELIHGVMNLLWPHYLRPVPAMSLLEFSPIPGAVTERKRIPAMETEVESGKIEGTGCRFRTTAEVDLYPFQLEQVSLEAASGGHSALRLRFTLLPGATLAQAQVGRLRLYLVGEPAYTLYYWLCRHVSKIRLRLLAQGRPVEEIGLTDCQIQPFGFSREEALLPYPKTAFDGYRLLQEYLTFPQKFLAVDLSDLQPLSRRASAATFEILILFTKAPPASLRVSKEHVRLFCTPIVNLFKLDSQPIQISHERTEYLVRPSAAQAMQDEIFSVDGANGHLRGTGEELHYEPFYSFRHGYGKSTATVYYQTHLRQSVVSKGGAETYVSFVNADEIPVRGVEVPTEIVTFNLTCTNRDVAGKLRVGDIQVPTDSSPGFAQFKNITRVSAPCRAPVGGDLHWRLLSHLSLNYLSLTSVEALRGLVDLYNFAARQDEQARRAQARLLEGIVDVQSRGKDHLFHGVPIRGTEVTLSLKQDHFAGEGDMFLFASVLSEFFALYASVNSFTQLVVNEIEQGEQYSWPSRIGQQIIL